MRTGVGGVVVGSNSLRSWICDLSSMLAQYPGTEQGEAKTFSRETY